MIKVWMMAARPKTLTAALIPVVVGTALTAMHQLSVDWVLALCCFLCAVGIQVGTNLINDALDFKKGTDTEKRIGPIRVAQQGLLTPADVMKGGAFALFFGALFGLPLVMKGGVLISFMLAFSLLLAYLYTGGPYPLSYRGLGELFVFIFFGLVGTAGTFYIQTLHFGWPALVAGAQIGLLATLMIAVNNVRDYYTDKESNKRTIVVRFGVNFGKGVITFCALAPFLINFYWKAHPFAALLPLIPLPIALVIVQRVWSLPPSKAYNEILGTSALLHLSFGLFLAIGLVL